MSPEFELAYLRHAALSFEKQLALQDLIGERNWSFDMNTGQLVFGKKKLFDKPLVFDVQILGSASQAGGSWLWSWANPSVNETLTRASLFLRDQGALSDFQTPMFPVDFEDTEDHRIALTSVGVLAQSYGCDAYYRGPAGTTALYFLLNDQRLHLAPPSALRLSTFFPMFLQSVPVADHRAAFTGYLEARDLDFQSENDAVTLQIGGSTMTARFDNLNRLANLQVNAKA